MNNYGNLMNLASKEMGICRGATESDDQWKARTIYSILGRMAYASLFDTYEEYNDDASSDEPVSIIHLKRRVQDLYDCYVEMYPEISLTISIPGTLLSNLIYDILLKTGYIYHEAYRVCASAPSCAVEGSIRFERGMPLNRHQYISGLGTYTLTDAMVSFSSCMTPSICDMYCLTKGTLSEQWKTIISNAHWTKLSNIDRMEYLDENNSAYVDSWLTKPYKNHDVSLSRIKMPGFIIFYLYRYSGNELVFSQLPEWMTYDPHFQLTETSIYNPPIYRNLICYCLSSSKLIQPFKYYTDGEVAYMIIPSNLPLPELYFISLYSWPLDFSKTVGGFRAISIRIFVAIKTIFERIGFKFMEVSKDVIRCKLHS